MFNTITDCLKTSNDKTHMTSKLHNKFQIKALEIVGAQYERLALKFSNYDQLAILNKLKEKDKENIELALEFENHNQFLAFEELSKLLHTSPEQNARASLRFTEFSQVEALKLLKDNKSALSFTSHLSLDTLQKIGINHVDLALKFKSYVQYDALNIVTPDLALQITTYQQLYALSKLGAHCFNEALKASTGELSEMIKLSELCSTRLAEQDLTASTEELRDTTNSLDASNLKPLEHTLLGDANENL